MKTSITNKSLISPIKGLKFDLMCGYFLVFWCILFFSSCTENDLKLKPVTYSDFEQFVNETGYVTVAEKYGWSIVQIDVYNYEVIDGANWRFPNGSDSVSSKNLPVTQVSYNDALVYCKWAGKRLPTYEEYWSIVQYDDRVIATENRFPISNVKDVNIVGNVWDITEPVSGDSVRLAGGSVFCSETTCKGFVEERRMYVDAETGNIHIGFSVL